MFSGSRDKVQWGKKWANFKSPSHFNPPRRNEKRKYLSICTCFTIAFR